MTGMALVLLNSFSMTVDKLFELNWKHKVYIVIPIDLGCKDTPIACNSKPTCIYISNVFAEVGYVPEKVCSMSLCCGRPMGHKMADLMTGTAVGRQTPPRNVQDPLFQTVSAPCQPASLHSQGMWYTLINTHVHAHKHLFTELICSGRFVEITIILTHTNLPAFPLANLIRLSLRCLRDGTVDMMTMGHAVAFLNLLLWHGTGHEALYLPDDQGYKHILKHAQVYCCTLSVTVHVLAVSWQECGALVSSAPMFSWQLIKTIGVKWQVSLTGGAAGTGKEQHSGIATCTLQCCCRDGMC